MSKFSSYVNFTLFDSNMIVHYAHINRLNYQITANLYTDPAELW